MLTADPLAAVPPILDQTAVRIAVAAGLGLFLGLEREWSQKPAGVRTFSLLSILGAVFGTLGSEALLAVGGLLVVAQGVALAVRGLSDDVSLSLTTAVSMLVAYGVGVLVANGAIVAGVTVAVLSSVILVLKRELHGFALGLSRTELRSVTEFAVLAFVVLPLLPPEYVLSAGGVSVTIEPRIVWSMVVTVAAIGIANYAIVATYGARGLTVTGFVGGLASSTAVVGSMIDHVKQGAPHQYAVAAILLADAAMALRNLGIALAFTLDRPLTAVVLPLGGIVAVSVIAAIAITDRPSGPELELESPFSTRNALGFGAVFLAIVVIGSIAQASLGDTGLYVTAALAGLVSSAGVTTSAVVLYRTAAIPPETATIAILIATGASIGVKAGLVTGARNRTLSRQVWLWSGVLLGVGVLGTLVVI